MTILLTAAFLLAAGALAYLAIVLSNYGLIGCVYMLSARIKAIGDGVYSYRLSYAEYRRQALDAAPRPVIDVPVESASNPALPVRTRPALLGRLARIAGKAARRPAVWRDAEVRNAEG